MIYILSGVAKSGKTFIANKILKEYQISSFSTDYLMMTLARANESLGIDPDGDDALVADQLEPYLYMMIKTMIENQKNYLIEGVHFNPPFAEKLLQEFTGNVKFVYLGYANIDPLKKINELKMFENQLENRWYSHYTDKQMIELIQYMKLVSDHLKSESKKRDIIYFEVDNIELQADEIIRKLLD